MMPDGCAADEAQREKVSTQHARDATSKDGGCMSTRRAGHNISCTSYIRFILLCAVQRPKCPNYTLHMAFAAFHFWSACLLPASANELINP